MTTIPPNKRKFVTLILTESCNLACTYCYEHYKTKNTMPLEVAKKIIDDEMTKQDFSELVCFDFFGGEPFLEFEKIKTLVEYIKNKKFDKPWELFVGTNGTLVHHEIQDWLIENLGVVNCGLSLDGTKFMHDINRSNSFDMIDLDFFLKTYPNIIIKMTVSIQTLPHIAEGVKFLHQRGFKSITCNLAYGIDWSEPNNKETLEKQLNELIEFYLENPSLKPCSMLNFPIESVCLTQQNTTQKFCGAGTQMHTYDVKGDMYPCHFFTPFSAGEKSADAKNIKFSNTFPRCVLDKKCQNCIAVDICPTCYGSNFLSSGNIFSKTEDFCNLTKIMIRATALLKAKKWEKGLLKLSPPEEKQLLESIIILENL